MSGTSASESQPAASPRALAWLQGLLSGWRFAAAALALIVGLKVVALTFLLLPIESLDPVRVWCFSYDPATGSYVSLVPIVLVFLEPLVLGVLVFTAWWSPLSRAWRQGRRQFLGPVVGGLLVAGGLGGCLGLSVEAPVVGDLPFPAERIRTERLAPEVRLVDQHGVVFDRAGLEGEVVLLTAVYASCGSTCPMIFAQARASLDEVGEDRVHVVAVTLDPARDTPEVLGEMARLQGLAPETWHLLTGEVSEVETTLDRMDVTRSRDPETGVIEHANLFLLIDRSGRVAYTLTLGDQQQRWLTTALLLLVEE